jgi:hypothetical protein
VGKTRLLIGSCVCQTPRILEKFLQSLKNLELSAYETVFMLADDNQISASSEMLRGAELSGKTVILDPPPRETDYYTNETTHFWNNSLVMRVADLKNAIIAHAIEEGFDYLFLIDSDLLVNPNLINHLMAQNKAIVSEIFWTRWQPDTLPMPNAWMYDMYEMAHPANEPDVRRQLMIDFFERLSVPGVYEVGGLGACTLLSVPALKAGLSFLPVRNVSFWGEDRWFCIRAAALGFPLYMDTHYPAKHLYRESDVE